MDECIYISASHSICLQGMYTDFTFWLVVEKCWSGANIYILHSVREWRFAVILLLVFLWECGSGKYDNLVVRFFFFFPDRRHTVWGHYYL
jgi:hypothetical protein